MKAQFNVVFLLALTVLVGLGVLQIFKPYLIALVLAFIFSQFFKGWYRWFLKRTGRRKALAATLTCFLVFLLLFLPLLLVVRIVVAETVQFIQLLDSDVLQERVEFLLEHGFFKELNFDPAAFVKSQEFLKSAKEVGNLLVGALKSTYQGAAHFLFMVFVMFFALYYFLKDGQKLLGKLMEISPLRNEQEKTLLRDFIATSRATLKGSLVIAIIQGTLTGLALWIAGVSSPAFWGLVATIFSFLPMVGSGLVWLPAGVILLFFGNVWQGIFVILFGALVVSMLDNFLRPKLVGNATSLHPLLVFLATLGGIAVYGVAGFILGPIVVALFITLLGIYQAEFRGELKNFNR